MGQVQSSTPQLITVPTKSVIGTIPDGQPPGTVKDGLLYYANPGPNWFVKGGVAYESCPPGFTDTWSRCEYAIPATQISPPIPEYQPCDQSDGPGAHAVGLECWKPTGQVCADDCSKGWDGCKHRTNTYWSPGECARWGKLTSLSLVNDHCEQWGVTKGGDCIGGCITSCSPVESLVRSSVNRHRYCNNPNEEVVAGLCQPKCPAGTTRQAGLCAAGFQRNSHPTAVVPAICPSDRFDFQGLCYKNSDFDSPGENKWGIRSAGIAYLQHQELTRRDREDPRPKGGRAYADMVDNLATLQRPRWDRGAGRALNITARVKDRKTGVFDPLEVPTCKSLKDKGEAIDYDNPKVCRDETPNEFFIDESGTNYIAKCSNLWYKWVAFREPGWGESRYNRGGSERYIKTLYTGDASDLHNEPHSFIIEDTPGVFETHAWDAPFEPSYDDGYYPSDMYCNQWRKQKYWGEIIDKNNRNEMGSDQKPANGKIPITYGWYGGPDTLNGFYVPDPATTNINP